MNRDEPAPEVLHEPGSSLAQDPLDLTGAYPDPEMVRDGIHPKAENWPPEPTRHPEHYQAEQPPGLLDEESLALIRGQLSSLLPPAVAAAMQEVLKPLRPNFETPAYDGPVAECQDGLKRAKAPRVRYDLMPAMAELEIVKALSMGAAKYDAGKEDTQGWQHPSRTHRMLYSAARRHLEARRHGELTDGEPGNLIPGQTGLQHLALAIVNLIFILEADLRGWTDKDNFDPLGLNRPKD